MAKILQSLTEVSTNYWMFEKDQVLTANQLNEVVAYLDDQTRCGRVALLGVGLLCGLRISFVDKMVTLSPGIGITTDGDLAYVPAPIAFDRFKPYAEDAPKYPPFFARDVRMPLFELVRKGTQDDRAIDLAQFVTDDGTKLDQMTAILFVESYSKDQDLCSGTDCDNLGMQLINETKLLVVGAQGAKSLASTLPTPGEAARAWSELVAERPIVSSKIDAPDPLAKLYAAACNSIHDRLATELPKLYQACAPFLSDTFAADPTSNWIGRLKRLNSAFGADVTGIQYYYDFLKDLVATGNELRCVLFGSAVQCCPDVAAFPKHLLLGNVAPGSDPTANRMQFYPSSLVGNGADRLAHAQFLARKLDAMLMTMQLPDARGPIRVTPSLFEDSSLEDRAIRSTTPSTISSRSIANGTSGCISATWITSTILTTLRSTTVPVGFASRSAFRSAASRSSASKAMSASPSPPWSGLSTASSRRTICRSACAP
jgi:hypothetical protein